MLYITLLKDNLEQFLQKGCDFFVYPRKGDGHILYPRNGEESLFCCSPITYFAVPQK